MSSLQEKQKVLQAKIAAMIRPSTISNAKSSEKSEEKKEDDEQMLDSNANNDINPSSYGYRPKFSSVNINADKWLLTMDEESRAKLENPPSLADGIDRKTEEDLRYLGCELIQCGSILLRLPQTAAATGQIIFQRFYYQKSFVVYHFEHAVMACLLLASKIEEAPRRPRDVINVFHRLEQLHRLRRAGKAIISENTSRLPPKLLDAKYVQTKALVIKTERRILTALGFVVHVKHPHKLIFSYAHTLGLGERNDLLQKAWSYMNDGLRTDMFLRYTPETIACACIYLAARTCQPPVALPETPFMWFELFDASDRDVDAISVTLLTLYQRRQVNWNALNIVLEKAHDAKVPKKPEEDALNKAEAVRKKLDEEGKKRNGENGENGKGRSRSRSRERDRRYKSSPRRRERKEERRGKEKVEVRGREKDEGRGREKEERRDKDREREKERSRKEERRRRSRERMHHKAKEHSRQREVEVYQALGKRNHR